MAEPIISNPIGWLQIKLIGGWKKVLQITGICAAAIAFFHVLIYRAMGRDVLLDSFCSSAFIVMTVAEAIILLMAGPGAIKKAIQRDFTTDMISSHRQTGMSGGSAVFGYMTGATMQMSLLAILCWLTCSILALLAGTLVSNLASTAILALLAVSAAMYWSLAVLTGLVSRGKLNAAGIAACVALLVITGLLDVLPGLSVLVGAPIKEVVAGQTGAGAVAPALAVSLLSQALFTIVFFSAAARKYARDDVVAFSPALAFVLLSLCALLGAVGLKWFSDLSVTSFSRSGFSPSHELIATLVALLLTAFLPVSVAARLSAAYGRRKSREPALLAPKPRFFVEAPIAATLLVFVILIAVLLTGAEPLSITATRHSDLLTTLTLAALPFLFAVLTVAGLLRFTYAYTSKASWVLFAYVVVIWVLPPLGDLGIEVVQDRLSTAPHSMVLACSPIGAWIVTFMGEVDAPLLPGIVFQGILAVGALILASRARH